ncbi:MAG: VWA domain-containing protein, partial [Phycisphaerae bacterium]|nr:VWA domain-containing protein [Phycisphaerae bacterium]
TESREGGTKRNRLQMPLLFFLELLILAALAIAASGPRSLMTATRLPLVVVLDNSYSMLAAGDAEESARQMGLEALEAEMEGGHYRVRCILAGQRPQMLGDGATSMAALQPQLDQWRCDDTAADLSAAVGLAAEVGGKHARILVISDHAAAPEGVGDAGRVQWWSLGRARANLAFVAAARGRRQDKQRCLFEIANLSDQPGRTEMQVVELRPDGSTRPVRKVAIDLEAEKTRRVFFDLPDTVGPIEARLGKDTLAADNRVTLLPVPLRPVRVQVAVTDERMAARVRSAVSAVDEARLVGGAVDLLITDRPSGRPASAGAWVLRLIAEQDTKPYLGPFVIDRAHPLTEGVDLVGVVWAAGKSDQQPGRPLVTAANVPLLSDQTRPDGTHDLRLRVRAEHSTLTSSLNWPVLFWNLVHWRRDHLPGVGRVNRKVGEQAELILPGGEQPELTVLAPDGTARQQAAVSGRLDIPLTAAGVWQLGSGERKWQVVANLLDRDESDLRSSKSERQGDWAEASVFRWEYRSIAWIFGLLAVILLTAHLALISVASSRGSVRW